MKDIIINGIFCIIETIIIVYYFEASFERRGLTCKSSVFPAFFIMLSADIIITFFNIPIFIQLAMFIILCNIVLITLYNGKIIRKIYVVFMTIFLTMAPSLLIIYVMSWVSNTNYSLFIRSNDSLRFVTNITIKVFQFTLIKAFIFISKKNKIQLKMRRLLLYIFILMISVTAIVFIRNSLNSGIITSSFTIYATISIIAIDSIVYLLLYVFSEISRKNNDIEIKNQTIYQQQKDIENISREYYETLKIRHDIKKYLYFASELIEQEKYDELKEYLNSFQENIFGNTKTFINTENKMFNAIINKKLNEAESLGIKIECCVFDNLSNFNGIDDLELCIIFSNLLDNAIEAEKNVVNPMIKFLIFKKAGYACFKIENIVNKNIFESNPNLDTTKKEKKGHGIGLKNVREIIDKQDGIFNIVQNGNWFCAEVMLLRNLSL